MILARVHPVDQTFVGVGVFCRADDFFLSFESILWRVVGLKM